MTNDTWFETINNVHGCIEIDNFVVDKCYRVMARLCVIDPIDFECAYVTVVERLMDGWSEVDTLKYVRLTEHVSPHLSEEYALRCMGVLHDKYPNNGAKSPPITP